MIHLFDVSRRFILFPTNWANSLVRWVQGIHSPSGTIIVKNELNPGDGVSMSLDVDIEVVAKKIKSALVNFIMSRDDVIDIINGSIDGSSLLSIDGRISVSDDWVRKVVGDVGGSGSVSSVDGVQPDANGNVNLNLASDRPLRVSDFPASSGIVKFDGIGFSAGSLLASDIPAHGHVWSDITGRPDLSTYLQNADVGVSVQEHSDKIDALDDVLTSEGKVPLSHLTGNIDGHSGTCYVTIDNAGNLGHSENLAYELLNDAKDDDASALATDKCLGNGLQYSSSKFSVKLKSASGLSCDSSGLGISQLAANKWMKTDSSGNLSTTNDSPVSVDSTKTGLMLNTAGSLSYVTPKSGTTNVTVVTGLSWNGTQLIASKSKLTFTNGVLTNVANATSDTIGTVTFNV